MTEVKFPCRTSRWCTNRFPYRTQWHFLRQRLVSTEATGSGCKAEVIRRANLEGKTLNPFARHIEDCKVGAEVWLVQNFGLRKDFGFVNCQIHQPVFPSHRQRTKVTRRTSFMELSLIEPTNLTNCPRQVHQPQHNHGRTDHGLQLIRHGKVIGNILFGDIHKTCGTHLNTTIGGGYHNPKGSFTADRWTQLALLANFMTHTTFTQSNLSVSSAVVKPLFSSMCNRGGDTFATSASAKQKPVHCSAMRARKISDKNAVID